MAMEMPAIQPVGRLTREEVNSVLAIVRGWLQNDVRPDWHEITIYDQPVRGY